jgi:iron complex transport system substrate-binding protein
MSRFGMPGFSGLPAATGPFGARALLGVIWAWAVLAAVPAVANPVSVRDDRGVVLQLAQPPQRIVSLLPSLTETVCALSACARLVGVDRYSDWPVEVRALPKLGGLEDTQIERIVALRPDVVLVARAARVIERLESLGLRVLAMESQTHDDVRRTLAVLATLLGTPQESDRLWRAMERAMAEAAARVPAALRGQRVYFEVGGGAYAAGPQSFIGETLSRLGMGNVVAANMGPFPKLNPEYVVRANPDVVMTARREVAGLASRPGWQDLQALARRQVCGFEPARSDVLVRPGPRMGEAAGVLADCLAGLPAAGAR